MAPAGADPNPLITLLRDCVVRIDDAGGGFLGTGFFVAPGVVLTCAHVVHGAAGVKLAWRGEEVAATVVDADPPLDEVPDRRHYPMPDLATIDAGAGFHGHPCVRLGPGPSLGEALYVAGFTIEHARDQVALTGAGTAFESAITEDGITFYKLARGQVLPGFSGAPLLDLRSGDVCGVVESTRDRRADLGGFAVPAEALAAAFLAASAASAAFHTGDRRWQDAVEAERTAAQRRQARRPRLPLAPATVRFDWSDDASPADALRARHAVVPFVGRAELLAGIEQWCEAQGDAATPVAVWFVTAGGGFGKTRVAVESCLQAEARGWTAGLLNSDLPDAKLAELGAWPGPLLVAVDYAETRPVVLRRLVEELASQAPRPPVRLLLLVRRGMSRADLIAAFNDQREEALGALLRQATVSVLEEAEGEIDRLRLYDEARRAFARLPGGVGGDGTRPRLRAAHFARPLFVLVAAFLLTRDRMLDVDALSEHDLLRLVLSQHEVNYWARAAQRDGLTLDPADQRVAVALATLLTAAGEDEALGVAALIPHIGSDPARRIAVARWLARLYGGAGTGASLRLGPLEPDRLGEVLVADVLGERPALLESALDHASPRQLTHALTVASRIAGIDSEVRDRLRVALDRRLTAMFSMAFDGDADLLTAMLAAVRVCRPLAGALAVAEQLPAVVPVRALEVAVTLTEMAAEGVAARADVEPSLLGLSAGLLNNLANRLGDVGRRAEALDVIGQAVGRYRELARADPDAFLPDLAMALNNLAGGLSGVGRRDEALDAAEEAVDRYRELAGEDRVTYLSKLAGSISNLANRMGDVGRRAEARHLAAEAVELGRELAATDRSVLPALATWLNNLAICLHGVGRRADALDVAKEAVGLGRDLVETDRDAFLPDLTLSLTNEAALLSAAGRADDAIVVATEAVDLRRELVDANHSAFLPDLLGSLANLAGFFSDVGDQAKAIEAAAEAVDGYEELVQTDPGAFLPELARSLGTLAQCLGDAGRREAVAVAARGVTHYRELAGSSRGAFLPALAGSLVILAKTLLDTGRRAEALGVAAEAVSYHRELADLDADAFIPELALALNILARSLNDLGRAPEALDAIAEAVQHHRDLVDADPGAFLSHLAGSLTNLAKTLGDVGRRAEAIDVATEAVARYRELARGNRTAVLPALAMSLNNLAGFLNDSEAVAPATEAVELYRELADSNRASLPDLAMAIDNLAELLVAVGRTGDAEGLWQDAFDRYGTAPSAQGHFALRRGRSRAGRNQVAAAIGDLVEAMGAFAAVGDLDSRATARMLLREIREADAAAFDVAWPAGYELPPWLRHPAANEALADALMTWIRTPDWAASMAYLDEQAGTLLADAGEAELEHLVDLNPTSLAVLEHLRLLQDARAAGVGEAYEAHARRRQTGRLGDLLIEWLATPSWEASQSFAGDNHDELVSVEAAVLFEAFVADDPRNPNLRLHHGLLVLLAGAGIGHAYALLFDSAALDAAISAETPQGPTTRLLGLSRLASGLVPDSPEAHFRLASVAIQRGDADEAAAALTDCADHAAPFERADFARRLDLLAGDHADVARLVVRLRTLLEV